MIPRFIQNNVISGFTEDTKTVIFGLKKEEVYPERITLNLFLFTHLLF